VLELYRGPTAAFKDVGARFLAECLARSTTERTILVATSGDTGGAVAAAFWRKPGIEVGVLFPKGGVSELQQHQLTCWGDNVHAFAVRGTFDDCQGLLKRALADPGWRSRSNLTTANSINIGRLLPQVVYYAWAALRYRHEHGGVAPSFLVPSGNVGNATAALWARAMGVPIRGITMVANANRTVPDFFATGEWAPRPAVPTLANAMDVGTPSNMERVFDLFGDRDALRAAVRALSVSDHAIREAIRTGKERYGRVWDPHTATAVHAFEQTDDPQQILVATAHPAKFRSVVEPLAGEVEMPPALADLLAREAHHVEIEPELAALVRAMAG
jgi:threonine synthase